MLLPTFPFRPVIFGAPYHGLIQGGNMTLANASTIAYAQPAGGDVLRVKPPGNPTVSRSAEGEAEDAAAGHVWLDHAFIAGTNRQLAGRNLGANSWIYCTAPGECWHIKLTTTNIGSSLDDGSFSFEVKRFGLFDGTSPAATTQTIGPVALGQATPVIANSDPLTIYLEDVNEDGSIAILGLRSAALDGADVMPESGGIWGAYCYAPLGFLRVDVSAGPVIDVTVLANRETTLGTLTREGYANNSGMSGAPGEAGCWAVGTATLSVDASVLDRIMGYWVSGAVLTPVLLDVVVSSSSSDTSTVTVLPNGVASAWSRNSTTDDTRTMFINGATLTRSRSTDNACTGGMGICRDEGADFWDNTNTWQSSLFGACETDNVGDDCDSPNYQFCTVEFYETCDDIDTSQGPIEVFGAYTDAEIRYRPWNTIGSSSVHTAFPLRFSGQVYGLCAGQTANYCSLGDNRGWKLGPLATKYAGNIAGPGTTQAYGTTVRVYGTQEPDSGAVTIATSPVCYA